MRKLLSSACVLLAVTGSYAQPLFNFGKNKVSKEEFLRQFNRNLSPNEDRQKAMAEYLPLFINYKLKVQDAYDKKLDAEVTQKNELVDFRRQIEDTYFSEAAQLSGLVNEAFLRSQKDLHVYDIIIAFDPLNPTAAAEAEAKAQKAFQMLEANTAFEKVHETYSTDRYAGNANTVDLGWITAFTLPYKAENAIYAAGVGQFTKPVRTSKAFHIFKVVAERKALGKVKVAQILFSFQPGASDEAKKVLLEQANSVYDKIMNGASFATKAKELSTDKTSYQNGGLLPEFGVGTYDAAFENAAFGLAKKGDVCKPFATSYGYHILQLVDRMPIATDANDPIANAALKQLVANDNRMEAAKTALVKSLLPTIGFVPSKTLNTTALWKFTDSAFVGKSTAAVKEVTNKTEIFRFAKQTITAANWVEFIKSVRGSVNGLNSKSYQELLDTYVNLAAAEYYKSHLEDYNVDFKNQLQEFKDANLNFEVTERMVWNKAAEDQAGLAKQYAAHKTQYKWGPSLNAIIVTGIDKAVTDTVRQQMASDIANWRAIATQYENKILADSNRFEQNQVPVQGAVTFKPNMITPTITNVQDSSQTFCYIVNVINEPGQRSFEDARGFVINDYQQVLETRWIESLKKKYPVVVNDAVWKALLKK